MKSLDQLHLLNNIEITNYFNDEPRFHGLFSRNNLPWINDGVYVISIIKIVKELGFIIFDKNLALYFDPFDFEYIPQEVLNKIKDKSITHNIFRIQNNESIMCRFYCIAFIEYMLVAKTLLDYTNFFSQNEYKNGKIIYKYFKDKYITRSKSRF